jgi:hypothetical protein
MSEEVRIALIASGAALFGGVVGILGSVMVERQRAAAARRSRVEERLLDAMVTFDAAAVEYRVALETLPRRAQAGHDEAMGDLETRTERLRGADARLELLAPDDLRAWLVSTYGPAVTSLRAAAEAYAYHDSPRTLLDDAVAAHRSVQGELRTRARSALKDLRLTPRRSRRTRRLTL